jgi:hypothetical protein
MGGALVHQVGGHWPSPEAAVAAARHIVSTCAIDPRCELTWETSRLDAVAGLAPVLADAGGDAVFHTADPGPLIALLREAGLNPRLDDNAKVHAIGYARILDALEHAVLASDTTLSIETGARVDLADERGPDDMTVDRIVAAAGDDGMEVYWGCRWFGVTSDVYNFVSVGLNGDLSMIDGHSPGKHQLEVGVNYKLADAEQLAARIASTCGLGLVYRGLR